MTERGVRADRAEAARLYERGVAAARAGQRRVAASLLSRAVQRDPGHEQAWLWLSGVLDDPNEIAFCLRSVLNINPANERARRGLEWLATRQNAPEPAAPAPTVVRTDTPTALPEEHDGWWVRFRQQRREMNRAWVLVWSALILLWVLLLGLNYTLRQTVTANAARMQAALATSVPVPSAEATATPRPAIGAAPDGTTNAQILAYLSQIEPMRAELRSAVERYQNTTQQPGSSVQHATAARTLRDQIETTATTLRAITPPPTLAEAHDAYLNGLDQERAAMADLLDFYGSYSIQLANRAVLRLLDADAQIGRARAAFDQASAAANTTSPDPFTVR